jgi:hypothetical protein
MTGAAWAKGGFFAPMCSSCAKHRCAKQNRKQRAQPQHRGEHWPDIWRVQQCFFGWPVYIAPYFPPWLQSIPERRGFYAILM